MTDLAKIVDDLSKLTVLEAAELAKLLEEKWGVSAAAAVAVAAAPAGAAAAPAEEQTEFTVILKSGGDKKGETPTVVTIPHIDDEGCIATATKALKEVEGVGEIKGDIAKKTVTIYPKPGAKLSPKAIWEALDKTEEKPSKLDGPSGLFTSKPPD